MIQSRPIGNTTKRKDGKGDRVWGKREISVSVLNANETYM